MSKRVKIVSGGNAATTEILVDGKALENVEACEWKVDTKDSWLAHVTLTLYDVPVELEGVLVEG